MRHLNSAGNDNAQFNISMGIAMNSANHIIIADPNNIRIQVLDKELNYISQFGTSGDSRGVAVDVNDNIYVCDVSNHRIVMYDKNGI